MDIDKLTLECFMGKKNYHKYLAQQNDNNDDLQFCKLVETYKDELNDKINDMLNDKYITSIPNKNKLQAYKNFIRELIYEIESQKDDTIPLSFDN
jgi:hypothetical protein